MNPTQESLEQPTNLEPIAQPLVVPPAKKEDILRLFHQHDTIIRQFGVKQYGLFGSFCRNEAHTESDVDVLVEFEPTQKTFDNFIGLAGYLEEILGRKVDLITTESLSPYIGPSILREVEYVTFNP